MLRKRRVIIFYMTLLQLSLLVNFQKILLLISQAPVPITFSVMGNRFCNRWIQSNLPAFGRQCTIYNTFKRIHNSIVARYPGRNTQYTPHLYTAQDRRFNWMEFFIYSIDHILYNAHFHCYSYNKQFTN